MSGPTGQQRVILGPLTSTWTAPSACSVLVQDCVTCGVAWAAQTCFASTATSSVNFGPEDNTDCWPPRTSFASTPVPPLAGWGFYSPGLDCPAGMTAACSATGGGSSGWAVQFGLLESETAIGCCPPSYSCSNSANFAQTCVQTATSTSVQLGTCESDGTSGPITTQTIPATISAAAISSYTLYAPLIQINWQATDRPSSSGTSSSRSSSSPTPTPSPSSGLSGGAKAGIGIGVTLVALALLGLVFFIYWKRRHGYVRGRQDSPTAAQLHELSAAKTGPYAASEMPTRENISELPPDDRPDERVYELRG